MEETAGKDQEEKMSTDKKSAVLTYWKPTIGGAGITLLVGCLLFLYPWLSVETDQYQEPGSSFDSAIHIKTYSFIPLNNVKLTCNSYLLTTRELAVSGQPRVMYAAKLPYGQTLTPYSASFKTLPLALVKSASFEITVHYRLWFLPIHRKQTFHLFGSKDETNHWNWL